MNDINKNKESVITLIKWLVNGIRGECGDGDGIWYSNFYNIKEIEILIKENNLLPNYWEWTYDDDKTFTVGEGEEWLTITNDKHRFDTRPPWQLISIVF